MQKKSYDPLKNTVAREIMDSAYYAFLKTHKVGFMDGGCYIFAKALAMSNKDADIKVLTRNGRVDHYLVEIEHTKGGKSFLVDYEGIYSNKFAAMSHYIDSLVLPVGTKIEDLDIVDINETTFDNEILADERAILKAQTYFENIVTKLKEDSLSLDFPAQEKIESKLENNEKSDDVRGSYRVAK